MNDTLHQHREVPSASMHGVSTKGGPVFSHLDGETIEGIQGRAIASFGDSATLGMWAFATGAWITGLFQSNLQPQQQLNLLFPELLTYSGLVLFIAGLFLFRRNNTFFATAFCSFGAFNLTRGIMLLCQLRGVLPDGGAASVLEGCLIESFAYIAFSLFIAATQMNVVVILVLICTTIGYCLGGLPFLANTHSGPWAHAAQIGGYFLFGSGLFAYYGGTALLVNTACRRVVFPIGGQA